MTETEKLLAEKRALDDKLKTLGACTASSDGKHSWWRVPAGSWRDMEWPANDKCTNCKEERECVAGTPSIDGGNWY